MLKDLFAKQQSYINTFFDTLDLKEAERVLKVFESTQGALIFTGVGKSGHIAEKLAATYTSLGIRSHYLRPLDALHGDIGIVSAQDTVVLLSKSGSSAELLKLLPYIRERGAVTLAWTSSKDSALGKKADHHVLLPLEKELCKFDLAPTTSPAIQLIFGDVLAVHLMESRKLTLDAYQSNHPAGAIGKKSHRVEELMVQGADLPIVSPETKLVDALSILTAKRKGCVLITDSNQRLLGIFTDGDLRRALEKDHAKALEQTMEALMTPTCITVNPKMRAIEALKEMQQSRKVMMAPVIKENALIGLLHLHDLL